jgi:signal transduction histidine kinase
MAFNKKEFDFAPLIESTIDITRQTNPDYTISLHGEHQVKIVGDDTRIEQVLVNYLTNAIKYSPNNKIVEVSTELTSDHFLKVTIKDKGVGIPDEKIDDVFKKFYRVEENSHRFQGLGIGLYICSEIIRRHNGTFGVTSQEGIGSEFYFTLPIYKRQHIETNQEKSINEINCN